MTTRKAVRSMMVWCGLFLTMTPSICYANEDKAAAHSPRIVNIINFVRQCEPRIDWITEDVLYETVVSQIKLLKQHQLKGTFLLQYDAFIDARYQKLLKGLDEQMASDYLTKPGTSTQCLYHTLPVVDGFYWSSLQTVAGLRLKSIGGVGLSSALTSWTSQFPSRRPGCADSFL